MLHQQHGQGLQESKSNFWKIVHWISDKVKTDAYDNLCREVKECSNEEVEEESVGEFLQRDLS